MEISKWPKRYNWMIRDLRRAKKANANYLVSLGLLCYTEIVGRDILKYRNPNIKPSKLKGKKCFDLFLGEYMGYTDILKKYGEKLYSWYRHGLCHEYSIKGEKTGVYAYYEQNSLKAIEELGVDTTRGIAIPRDNKKIRFLVVGPYLKDLTKGIEKFLKESKQIIKN